MFERFAVYQGSEEGPNKMYPVSLAEIEDAEARMQLRFPSELRQFFLEVGCGFWRQGTQNRDCHPGTINRIVADPADIAAMVCDQNYPTRPCHDLEKGEIPFFDMGWRDYLLLNALSDDPNMVRWQSGSLMMPSTVEFFNRLYEDAEFYFSGPGTY